MKLSCLRPIAALLLTLGLAACGGKASYDVSGTVSNLNTEGLVLVNGGDPLPIKAGQTSFTFGKRIDYGTDYNITVQTQPAHMTCTVSGGTGSAGHYVSIQASVSCARNAYTVGGTVTGLTADGLVLINGNAQTTVAKGSTTFTLASPVADGDKYGISVFTQPTGLKCTVAPNTGVGVMGEANVTTVQIACNPG
ncbi:hypothetical protein JAB5_23730 [Janthinobacterium sp. HH103]|uniref:hypothetical protein n=1 Tax=unclassified Janthinobacterium TaxID=2610881 RepID=UPI000873D10A|nr:MULTISPECIES: hypothetical protein [unclassified Janthinobacterium]MCC7679419.1 hypothetical protein [Janthinobacterium sp. FW305-128]OEZ53662.1 hypothetical protein JAB2_57220 [Janthinobacterium sp. HH100]OEZ78727.1 hypothetical protein JAB5_23730 [Janthinobacterium sp. HH103]OEZ85445.1 hypothetical protein JAB8_36260 [Janthinobacterium sp. HH106]OEZ99514.1 hypothetical protein JAB9_21580 [Janthinobacterium sp. HH107]